MQIYCTYPVFLGGCGEMVALEVEACDLLRHSAEEGSILRHSAQDGGGNLGEGWRERLGDGR